VRAAENAIGRDLKAFAGPMRCGLGPPAAATSASSTITVRVVRSMRREEHSFYELLGELRFATPVGGTRTVQIRRRGEVPPDWLGRLGLLGRLQGDGTR